MSILGYSISQHRLEVASVHQPCLKGKTLIAGPPALVAVVQAPSAFHSCTMSLKMGMIKPKFT
ncbi:hypothetical protein [Alkalihalobacterium chitinilyticum]|uniref:Uncharacterized protein n=1 Tax=Alkalihalobacterium chitinilyticum TaxID=2980103 RepID=A0ABT5VEN8_9BACI|nr:hypothetical protein [Alkalihalobacterium chitinilyticum]MDE5413916.1 hypothetical protein [Alkalihalobacterium chitinilyticum]